MFSEFYSIFFLQNWWKKTQIYECRYKKSTKDIEIQSLNWRESELYDTEHLIQTQNCTQRKLYFSTIKWKTQEYCYCNAFTINWAVAGIV